MLLRFVISTLAVVLCATLPAQAAAERAETLRAINWVENPTNHARRGSKGELGPYQFRAETWRMHTTKPFGLAVVREHADEIAVKHYDWICRGLVEAGIDPNPFNVALAWNSGLGAVISGRVPMVTYNYAERVSNLVEAQRAQRQHFNQQLAAVVNPERSAANAQNRSAQAGAISPAKSAAVVSTASTIRFSLDAAPRFPIDGIPDPFEPVVYTDKAPADPAVTAVAINLEAPVFTLPIGATPRFALLQ